MTAELKAFPVFLSDIFLNDSIQPITLKLCTLLQYELEGFVSAMIHLEI